MTSTARPPEHVEPSAEAPAVPDADDLRPYEEDLAAGRPERSSTDLIGMLGDHVERIVADPTSQWDPGYTGRVVRFMERFNRYFAAEVEGWDNVPTDRAVLFVGNHSGGILSPDTAALVTRWYESRGFARPLALLTFDLALAIPGFGEMIRRIGGVPAGHEIAEASLASGASVVVYPGGDHEVYRPFWQRNHIDFDGRMGFVKLAIRTGTPIVPVVGHGGHDTMVVVARGDKLANRLGLDRVRVKVLPFALAPFGVIPAFLNPFPLPAKISLQVLEPIDLSHIDPADAEDPEILRACYDEVTERMQSALTAMAKARPFPVLSRLAEWAGRA